MAIDKEALLQKRLGEEDVEIPGVGSVRVRALSRKEAVSIRGVGMEPEVLERKMLALALVEPVLTETEIEQWQESSDVGEIGNIVDRIIEISGMEVADPKELMRQFRDGQ